MQPSEHARQENQEYENPATKPVSARQSAMALLARASFEELRSGLELAGCSLECEDMRPAEVGLVMARGRISGTGRPFNLGEVSVSRAAVRLACGTTGFSYLLGRDPSRARLAAIADAWWQTDNKRMAIETYLLHPVRTRIAAEKHKLRAQAAATQVDFFTMVRGDD